MPDVKKSGPKVQQAPTPRSSFFSSRWFFPLLFLLTAMLYFAPALTFTKIIMGTDDGPRGWYTKNYEGHDHISVFDKWSPLNGGTAFMERRFGRFINPMYPLYVVLPRYQARVFEYVFWVFIAGLFMFWYLRTIGISRDVAGVCALGFMLAPTLLSNIFPGHFAKMEVIALLPGIMAFVERLLLRFSLLDIAGLPILLALAIYSEHLQLADFVFWGAGAYFAARMVHALVTKKAMLNQAIGRSAAFAIALGIGALLTAMNTIPSMSNVNTTSKRAGGVDYEYASSFALHPEEVVMLAEPDFVGWKETYWGRNMLKFNSEYFGILFLLLAIMAFALSKPDFRKYLWAVFFMGALLFALGPHTPVHLFFYTFIPTFKSFRAPSMMYVWFFFPAIVLSASAIEELLAFRWKEQAAVRKRFLIFAGTACGLLFLYLIAAGALANSMLGSSADAISAAQQRSQVLESYLPKIKAGGAIILVIAAAFFCIAYLKAAQKLSRAAFLTILGVLIVLDLVRVSRPFFTGTLKSDKYFARQESWEQSIGQFLRQKDAGLYRVHALLGDSKFYIPGITMTYIFDDFTDKRYNDVIQELNGAIYGLAQMKGDNPQMPAMAVRAANILSFLNAKYLLVMGSLPLPGFEELVSSGGFRIYRNNQVFPRMYLADSLVPAPDPKNALFNAFSAPVFSRRLAIIDNRQNLALVPDADSTIADSVMIDTYDEPHGVIKAHVISRREQLLVIGENNARGWSAMVNGKPAPLLPVDYTWKGVIVPRRTSTVALSYNSLIAARWRGITLVSAIIFFIAGLLIAGIELNKRRKRKS
jgi:hypothetical protein